MNVGRHAALFLIALLLCSCGKKESCASGKCCQVNTGSSTSSFCVADCSTCRALVLGDQASCPATTGNIEGCKGDTPGLQIDGDLMKFLTTQRSGEKIVCSKACSDNDKSCIDLYPSPRTQAALSGITRVLVAAKDREVKLPQADLLALFGIETAPDTCQESSLSLGRSTAEIVGTKECKVSSTAEDDSGVNFAINYTVKAGTVAARPNVSENIAFVFDKGSRPSIEFIELTGSKRRIDGWAIDRIDSSPASAVMTLDVAGETSCMAYILSGDSAGGAQ